MASRIGNRSRAKGRGGGCVGPGIHQTNDQRRRLARVILAEYDGLEAVRLIVELGLGWAEPIT